MLAKIKSSGKKWLIRLYNAFKISGNILTFVMICLFCFGTLRFIYIEFYTHDSYVSFGKMGGLSKVIFFPLYSFFSLVWFYCAWKLAPKLFKIQKLYVHLFYWFGILLLLIIMDFLINALSIIR